MPHLTLEYSNNLEFDTQELLERLHSALVNTGAIQRKAIKSRAICLKEYRIADGNPEYAFVHVNLLIRAGRSIPIQEEISRSILDVLKAKFGYRFDQGFLSLSVDIKEMRDGIALTLHNIPNLDSK